MKRVLAAITLAFGLAASAADAAPQAQVAQGELSGKVEDGVSAFLGVPYAAPPVGDLRWRAPRAPAAWSGVRPADQFAPSCWQSVSDAGIGPWTSEYVVHGKVSEDCLYLNVWTPAKAGARLPVLVWIPGGAFTSGSGSVPIYNGAALARKGVIVVTINYRLGVLGFLAHPDLTREAGGDPPANFGLQDAVAALRWVRENIAAFGGDPGQVTVAGQSAGSMAVHDLIVSKLAKGLFARAIAESGLPDSLPPTSLADAEASGAAFAESIAALRAMPVEALAEASGGQSRRFAPIVDGVLIAEPPMQAVRAGRYNHTPVLAGMTADEGSANSPGWGVTDPAAVKGMIEKLYGPMADRFAAFYPLGGPTEAAEASRAILRDRGLAALYAWRLARSNEGPVFAYLFTHVEPGPQSDRWRVFHSSEMPYVFGTLDASPGRAFTEKDRALSRTLSDYWVAFIKTGDPNGAGRPTWPAFGSPGFEIMQLDAAPKARPVLPEAMRATVDDYLRQGGRAGLF